MVVGTTEAKTRDVMSLIGLFLSHKYHPFIMVEAGPSTPRQTTTEPAAAFERWRTSLTQWTGLGLTEDELAERAKRQGEVKLEKDWNRCEKWKAQLLERSWSSPASSSIQAQV